MYNFMKSVQHNNYEDVPILHKIAIYAMLLTRGRERTI